MTDADTDADAGVDGETDGDDGPAFEHPIGGCPGCGARDWKYATVGMFPARECVSCGLQAMHHKLGPSAPDLEGESPHGPRPGERDE